MERRRDDQHDDQHDQHGDQQAGGATLADALLEAAPDGTLVLDDDGVIVLANAQVETIFGYPRAELVGRLVEILLPDDLTEPHRAHRADYMRHRQTRPMGAGLQLVGRHREGHKIPVEISLSPLAMNGRMFTIAAVRDVTEQRHLQAERDQIMLALDASVDGVYLLDDELVIRYANRGAPLQSAYPMDDLIGRSFVTLFPPDDNRSIADAVATLGQRRTDRVTISTRLLRADGRTLTVEVVIQAAPDPHFAAYLCLVRDTTARTESERTLRRAREALLLANERERIARDLHDNVIQRLFASGLTLQSSLSVSDDAARERVNDVIEGIDVTIAELRHAIFELNREATAPGSFERELHKVISDAERALGFAPSILLELSEPMPASRAPDALAVVREALANAARHARPTNVVVRVSVDARDVRVTVDDDGIGVSTAALRGNGLDNMTARAQALDGQCSIGPRHGGGTRVDWRVPHPERQGSVGDESRDAGP